MTDRTRNIIGGVVGIVVLALLLGSALYYQRVLERGVPERIACNSQAIAWSRAASHGVRNVVAVLGTGSMAPFLPAAPAGKDPMQTAVAFVVIDPGRSFDSIRQGDLCVYRPDWAKGGHVLHQAAMRDSGGWIMSGLHNERSESWERMTQPKFGGVAVKAYVWARD